MNTPRESRTRAFAAKLRGFLRGQQPDDQRRRRNPRTFETADREIRGAGPIEGRRGPSGAPTVRQHHPVAGGPSSAPDTPLDRDPGARSALRAAHIVEKPGICRGRSARLGARDRVEHGHLQRRPCHVPGAAPLSRPGPARHGLVEQSGQPERHGRSRLHRMAPSVQCVLRLACHRHADGQYSGRRPAGTDASAGRDARLAGDDVPRPPARDGAAVSRRGRHAGQGPGGYPEPQALAGALRR
jgi:hypothetical protein